MGETPNGHSARRFSGGFRCIPQPRGGTLRIGFPCSTRNAWRVVLLRSRTRLVPSCRRGACHRRTGYSVIQRPVAVRRCEWPSSLSTAWMTVAISPRPFAPRSLPRNSPSGSSASITNFGHACGAGPVAPSGLHNAGHRRGKTHGFPLRCPAAVEYWGVSPNPLCNRVHAGKIITVRHRMNDYRLCKREDFDALLKQVSVAHKKAAK